MLVVAAEASLAKGTSHPLEEPEIVEGLQKCRVDPAKLAAAC
jgi:hypothetical protein